MKIGILYFHEYTFAAIFTTNLGKIAVFCFINIKRPGLPQILRTLVHENQGNLCAFFGKVSIKRQLQSQFQILEVLNDQVL